ncbi:glycosyl hydrolase 2 galactose-binding domain-containing protein [Undibacterium sp. TC9W]|uniref:glycosyl hydrolase 2 galactose-binding domain-containing protein n=1 Tax=Undibacterium sp. TC9W TaxID=3413053 RepID=UPI003BEF981C
MTDKIFIPISAGWHAVQVAVDNPVSPSTLPAQIPDQIPAQVPGTIASALRAAGKFEYGKDNFDEVDVWYFCELDLPDNAARLHFEGLATHVEVYWNDDLILRCENMFIAHSLDLAVLAISGKGRLSLRFLAMNTQLAQRRPRPRWKTRLVEQQQLRWMRTSLLGRMPGWSPPVAPVGPYRPILLELQSPVSITGKNISSRIDGADAVLDIELTVQSQQAVSACAINIGEHEFILDCEQLDKNLYRIHGQCKIDEVKKWWPHTHGDAALYALELHVSCTAEKRIFDLGHTGFRQIEVDQRDGDFNLHVNQVSVFCRGACWTPVDIISLQNERTDLRHMLTLARDAGMNMLRVVGTMVYETTAFYKLCDELGILVWQDCMFANMDYPANDEAFAASITSEVQQFLQRTQGSPCIAVVCGNSEVEQQAAMLGQPAELWRNAFFAETLPALCEQYRPDVQYWPSSPSGGVMPFQLDTGVAHYFGVGAYLRPLDDARRSAMRFTSECLGFSNMPDDDLIDSMLNNGETPGPHPAWKLGVPRDNGTGWDFEDVRDHYMAELYKVNPASLRYAERERYLSLARTTTGEVMAKTIAEWRRNGSTCHGALVWFWRDLRRGAGWGVIDAHGKPKAAYYYLKRAMAALTVLITDEGLNGICLHVINDGPQAFEGELELNLYRHAESRVAHGRIAVQVAAHSAIKVRDYALLPHFVDTSYAYRFGPAGHDVVEAALYDSEQIIANDFHFPQGHQFAVQADVGLRAHCSLDADGNHVLHLSAQKLAQAVSIQIPGMLPEDNYFHMAPGSIRQVRLAAIDGKSVKAGQVQAQNALTSVRVVLENSTISAASSVVT